MIKALFTGSFNPLTLGHLNIIERAASLFDTLVVGIAKNTDKSRALFMPEEIENMLKVTTAHLPNLEIQRYE
jgi:pantetheine-phosphate adenylyltransferase